MRKLFCCLALSCIFQIATAQNSQATDSVENLKVIHLKPNSLIGSKFEARNRTGSSYYMSQRDLTKFNYINY